MPSAKVMLNTAIRMERQELGFHISCNKSDLCNIMFTTAFMNLKDAFIQYLVERGWKKKEILKIAQEYCKALRSTIGKIGWSYHKEVPYGT